MADNTVGRPKTQTPTPNIGAALIIAIGVQLVLLWLVWSDGVRSGSTLRTMFSLLCGVAGATLGAWFLKWTYPSHPNSKVLNFLMAALVLSVFITMVFVEFASGRYDLP
jgi:hypothetical protein